MMLRIVKNTTTEEPLQTIYFDVRHDQNVPSFIYVVLTSEATGEEFIIPAGRINSNSRYLSMTFQATKNPCIPGTPKTNLSDEDEGLYAWKAYGATTECSTSGGTLYLSGMAYVRNYSGSFTEPPVTQFQPTDTTIVMYEP